MTTKKNSKDAENNQSLEYLESELASVKMLLILLLAKLGSDSDEIGAALGVSPSTVRNWISFSKVKKILNDKEKE